MLAWRELYGTADFIHWFDTVLPELQTQVIGGEVTPLEQVDAAFCDFVSGSVSKRTIGASSG